MSLRAPSTSRFSLSPRSGPGPGDGHATCAFARQADVPPGGARGAAPKPRHKAGRHEEPGCGHCDQARVGRWDVCSACWCVPGWAIGALLVLHCTHCHIAHCTLHTAHVTLSFCHAVILSHSHAVTLLHRALLTAGAKCRPPPPSLARTGPTRSPRTLGAGGSGTGGGSGSPGAVAGPRSPGDLGPWEGGPSRGGAATPGTSSGGPGTGPSGAPEGLGVAQDAAAAASSAVIQNAKVRECCVLCVVCCLLCTVYCVLCAFVLCAVCMCGVRCVLFTVFWRVLSVSCAQCFVSLLLQRAS